MQAATTWRIRARLNPTIKNTRIQIKQEACRSKQKLMMTQQNKMTTLKKNEGDEST